ncbi:MAG: hypothetical protein AB1505_35810 [Candidatus Latescibacterota bacterium]
MSDQPAFPVIAISPGDSFLVMNSPDWRCSRGGWHGGYFEGLILFDSAGRLWPTKAALERPFGLVDHIFSRVLPVQLNYGHPQDGKTADAIAMLEALVDADPDDLYDQFVTHDELKTLFREAKNPAELIGIARTLGAGSKYDRDEEPS